MEAVITDVINIIEEGRRKAYQAINTSMVEAYWLAGKRIVEDELEGQDRAEYGKSIIKKLADVLTIRFGSGYSPSTLYSYKQFYTTFSDEEIFYTLCRKLSWSHNRSIMRVLDKKAQLYYLKEAAVQNWGVRQLERNINTLYYQRLISSQNPEPVEDEMLENTKQFKYDNRDFIRNPTVLEFLNIPTNYAYTEQQLEQSLIDNLQQFLLELGKGFAFVARQKHIRTETSDFFIDLVFYNYILKCFVIIELKTDKITHQDIGQLDMYVRMFDDLERKEGDNPTVGILLCTETDRTIAKYSVLNESKQLFANKYLPYLPTEEELAAEIEREKNVLRERGVVYGMEGEQ
jgi:predicted nuclease of restriction endonuclease-like (RecB) superfamily